MTSLTKRINSSSCTYLRYKLTTTLLVPAELNFDRLEIPRSKALTRVEGVSSGKLFATMLLHIPYCVSAVRLNRLNIISVSSAEVEVEIFLSNRVNPLHELQTVLGSLCFLPS